jgi:exopolysaccharide biosynthesis polyprenyl glycosylphosphotransferase
MKTTFERVSFPSIPTPSTRLSFTAKQISRPVQWRLYIGSLLIIDTLLIYLALWSAYLVRFATPIPVFQLDVVPQMDAYGRLFILSVPVFISVFIGTGLYNKKNLLGGITEYSLIFRGTSISLFLLIIFGFLDPTFVIARGWLLLAWIFSFLFIAVSRFLFRRLIYALRKRGFFVSPALIVGANDEGLTLGKQLMNWATSGLDLIGYVDKILPPGTPLFNNQHVIGSVDELEYIVKQYRIEEIILATSAISTRDKMLEIFEKFGISNGVNLRLSSGLYEVITTGLTVNEFAYVPLVYVNKVRLAGPDKILKALLDYGITIPALILASPLMLLIAILIRLDSPGPVIHRRRVMGVSGTQFFAYKFRTMHQNGDEILARYPDLQAELEKNHKLKDDPRITRVGRVLRKFSLDELPQLFNVLKRQMSLVGPRMISPEEMKEYSRWGINLLTIGPGITGLWQVSGRSDVGYEERVRLDMQYIRNWSIWLDLQLLFSTIPAVIRGKGAY